ncbi:MAG: ribosomal subunit interface protein [Candidatus Melainabacteria bacterium GWF2_37_15]|nr:MAG: ribosomal subunit interface protein [Candidatus Melainabacteria bacterium GWF2_37_15]
MNFNLNGKNINITEAIKEYVKEKISRIVKHNGQIMNMKITLSVNKNPSVKKNSIAEVVCFLNGSVIKIKEDAESMYAAIDLLADRLDRQVKNLKEKLIKSKTGESIRISTPELAEEVAEETEDPGSEEFLHNETVHIELDSNIP